MTDREMAWLVVASLALFLTCWAALWLLLAGLGAVR